MFLQTKIWISKTAPISDIYDKPHKFAPNSNLNSVNRQCDTLHFKCIHLPAPPGKPSGGDGTESVKDDRLNCGRSFWASDNHRKSRNPLSLRIAIIHNKTILSAVRRWAADRAAAAAEGLLVKLHNHHHHHRCSRCFRCFSAITSDQIILAGNWMNGGGGWWPVGISKVGVGE